MTVLDTRRSQSEDELSASVDTLLREVVEDGFTFYLCGKSPDPGALVAAYYWEKYVDLLTVIGSNQVIAVRAVRHPLFDIFNPRSVVWAYGPEPESTIHALLHLMHPDHPDHVAHEFAPPQWIRVPPEQQRPLTVQAPKPRYMGQRAYRLDIAMRRDLTERAAAGLSSSARKLH